LKQKTIFLLLLPLSILSCTTKLVVYNNKKYDSGLSFHQGDSLVYFLESESDTLPTCNSDKNHVDSLKNIKFKYIDSITTEYIILSTLGNYSYDTITQKEKNIKKAENRLEYKRKWKHPTSVLYSEIDSSRLFIFKRPIYLNQQKIYYDSINTFVIYNHRTECGGFFKKSMLDLKYAFTIIQRETRLMRWSLNDYKIKVKERH